MIELNWVVLTWSCRYVDEVSSASSDRPPPGFFEIDQGNVSFSSFLYQVGREGPTFSGCKAHHNELGLNVTLPLNVSLDLDFGSMRDTT